MVDPCVVAAGEWASVGVHMDVCVVLLAIKIAPPPHAVKLGAIP
jgi:hypothetical protein